MTLMNLKTAYILFLIFIISGTAGLKAQWIKTDGPYGGPISCIAAGRDSISGNTNLYAGTFHSIYLSNDNGANWRTISTTVDKQDILLNVLSIAVSGNNLFAGTNGMGVYRSTDNGASWKGARAGLKNMNVNVLTADGNDLYAGTEGGAFLSTDNGTSWTEINNGLNNNSVLTVLNVTAITVNGKNVYAATSQGGLFLSTDKGANWKCISLPIRKYYCTSIAVSGSNLYVGTSFNGNMNNSIFLTTDNGTTWKNISTVLPSQYINSLAMIGSNLFAGTGSGIYVTSDNGNKWTPVNSGLTDRFVKTLIAEGNNLYAGTNSGVFLSANNGADWTSINTGISKSIIFRRLAAIGTNLFMGTNNGIYRSTDNGSNWTFVNSGLTDNYPGTNGSPHAEITDLFASGNNLFAGVLGDGMFKSTNNGASWSASGAGITEKYFYTFAKNGTILYAGGSEGIYLSTDEGMNWTKPNSGLPYTGYESIAFIDSNIFALSTTYGIFRSLNNGQSWSRVIFGSSNPDIFALTANGKNLIAGTSQGILISSDNGESWNSSNSGIGSTFISSFLKIGGNILAGSDYDGAFFSADSGRNWEAINTGLTSKRVSLAGYNNTYIFAVVNNWEIWKRPISDFMTSVKENSESSLSKTFSLEQNYPNPFNPETSIRYSIQKESMVELKVYDMLGREISTLVNQKQNAGSHTVQFNGSSLPSGIYIYTIHAGQYTDSKKFVILK